MKKLANIIISGALLCGSTARAVEQHDKSGSARSKTDIFLKVEPSTRNDVSRHFLDDIVAFPPIGGIPCSCIDVQTIDIDGERGGEIHCTCRADGFPVDGLTAVFFECWPSLCETCSIYQWDSAEYTNYDAPKCTSCTLCDDTTEYDFEFDCSNLLPSGTACAAQECSERSCIEAYESQLETLPPTEPPDEENPCQCFSEANGVARCYCFHNVGLITVLENCQESSDNPNYYYFTDCGSCKLVEEESISQIDSSDRTCTSCAICPEGSVFPYAQDCSNIYPNDPCMVDNCDGQCIGGTSGTTTTAPPTTTTPTMDGCELDQWTNTQTCRYQDAPFDGLTLVFDSCPASSTSLMDCQSCTISETESSTSRQTGRACNQCTMCSPDSTHTVSFDCSNLVPSNPCNIQDCSGNCVGQDNPGFPTPQPTKPTLPGFGFGDASLVALAPMMILVMLIAAMGSAL